VDLEKPLESIKSSVVCAACNTRKDEEVRAVEEKSPDEGAKKPKIDSSKMIFFTIY
jgi:hypothetical protein